MSLPSFEELGDGCPFITHHKRDFVSFFFFFFLFIQAWRHNYSSQLYLYDGIQTIMGYKMPRDVPRNTHTHEFHIKFLKFEMVPTSNIQHHFDVGDVLL